MTQLQKLLLRICVGLKGNSCNPPASTCVLSSVCTRVRKYQGGHGPRGVDAAVQTGDLLCCRVSVKTHPVFPPSRDTCHVVSYLICPSWPWREVIPKTRCCTIPLNDNLILKNDMGIRKKYEKMSSMSTSHLPGQVTLRRFCRSLGPGGFPTHRPRREAKFGRTTCSAAALPGPRPGSRTRLRSRHPGKSWGTA